MYDFEQPSQFFAQLFPVARTGGKKSAVTNDAPVTLNDCPDLYEINLCAYRCLGAGWPAIAMHYPYEGCMIFCAKLSGGNCPTDLLGAVSCHRWGRDNVAT
jgi:hypothetical protein